MDNIKNRNTDQLEMKEILTQHKNLGFYSQMLMRERESLLNQLEMYNNINKECFKKIKDLTKCCDSYKLVLHRIDFELLPQEVIGKDCSKLESLRSLLRTSNEMYEQNSEEIFHTFDMIQRRFMD